MVEPTNEMKSLQAQLRVEENKILFDMCKTIYTYREEIRNSLNAVAQVDLYRAKARLGVLLNGQIPEVHLNFMSTIALFIHSNNLTFPLGKKGRNNSVQ